MKRIDLLVLISLLVPICASAQSYEKILVPVAIFNSVPGQYGSRWRSIFTIYNHGTVPVSTVEDVSGLYPCYETGNCLYPIDPGHAFEPAFNFPHPEAPFPTTVLLYVKHTVTDQVSFSLKISPFQMGFDGGTDIPVVRERDALTRPTALTGVFLNADHRGTLRLYDFDARPNAEFRVRFRSGSGVVLAERIFSTIGSGASRPLQPGYLEVPLSSISELNAVREIINIDVVPLTEGVRYWAFVCATNNTTQRVSISTPG